MCGEKPELRGYDGKVVGSPPHMRGKVPGVLQSMERVGITPACAGKSAKRLCGGCQLWDHPRVCGEKKIMACYKPLIRGSPPHVRGKARRVCVDTAGSRITPACAGKRKRSRLQRSGTGDHPRVCGEKSAASFSCRVGRGSPPHVRGKAAEGLAGFQHTGITPAYAGKSRSARRSAHRSGITPAYAGKSLCLAEHFARRQDYPRMCGEKRVHVT